MTPFKTMLMSGVVLASFSAPASADWIRDRLSESCSAESRDAIANATRDRIEDHVSRAEQAIQPPVPVGDLGCLTDLMESSLDTFSGGMGLDNLSGIFDSTLDGAIDMGDGVTRNICSFAEEQWQEVTRPLTDAAASVGSLGDSFDQFNIPGSGGQSSGSTSGSSGSSGTSPLSGSGNQAQTGSDGTNWSLLQDGTWYDSSTGQTWNPATGDLFRNGQFIGRYDSDGNPLVTDGSAEGPADADSAREIWNTLLNGRN